MAPSKAPASWEDEDSDSSSGSGSDSSSAPSPQIVARRGKFDDEEEDDDVLESWDAAEDSEVEREKAKKAAEAKAKADAAAKASHLTKSQRIEAKREENRRHKEALLEDDSEDEETDAQRRARTRAMEKESDMSHTEDLFGGVGGVPDSRSHAVKPVTVQANGDPTSAIDLTKLDLFKPTGAAGFKQLRETLVPLLTALSKKPQYEIFMKEFTKEIVQGMSSDQVKKVSSGLTTVSNEKMREEKAAEKGGKKTKAAKTKSSLSAARDISMRADTTLYDDDGLDDGDFM